MEKKYPIGTPNKPWEIKEKNQWLKKQKVQRSYKKEVLLKIKKIPQEFDILQYTELKYENFDKYLLNAIINKNWDISKKTILVTGGVHGYETSGVHGAIDFALHHAKKYLEYFNIIIIPCVCPWGYETINRWTPTTDDPNRSFYGKERTDEANALMRFLTPYVHTIFAHFDLHETTNSDLSEFRPAKQAKDGTIMFVGEIPDGFYIIGDEKNPQKEFYNAIISSVKKITHIAPPDKKKRIIGLPQYDEGTILLDVKEYGVCASLSNAKYTITTEVYPNSKKTNPNECIKAQVAAIQGGIEWMIENLN